MLRNLVVLIAVTAALVSAPPDPGRPGAALAQPSRPEAGAWSTYRNAKFGASLSYPAWMFAPMEGPEGEDGRVFQSRDGRARLLVGALVNEENESLEDYRRYVMENTFAGALFDYMPRGQRWFVLSGTRGDTHFYQWVTFLCSGRIINSWAMTYPATERALYDAIVERVSKSYRPGGGRSGNCE